jgi:hypothetical protein
MLVHLDCSTVAQMERHLEGLQERLSVLREWQPKVTWQELAAQEAWQRGSASPGDRS